MLKYTFITYLLTTLVVATDFVFPMFSVLKPSLFYKVAVLVYEGVNPLELAGPEEAFAIYPTNFQITTVGKTSNSKVSSEVDNFYFNSQVSVKEANQRLPFNRFDMVFIPGSTDGYKQLVKDKDFTSELKQLVRNSKLVLTSGTGSLILASTNELSGVEATTSKKDFHNRTQQYKDVNWNYKARWIHDQSKKFITSAGLSSSTDASLYLVKYVLGSQLSTLSQIGMEWETNPSNLNDSFAI